MKIKTLIEELSGFDQEMDVKILPSKNSNVTEIIYEVAISKYPCPHMCILIKGT